MQNGVMDIGEKEKRDGVRSRQGELGGEDKSRIFSATMIVSSFQRQSAARVKGQDSSRLKELESPSHIVSMVINSCSKRQRFYL
jgi:hypothetical protein